MKYKYYLRDTKSPRKLEKALVNLLYLLLKNPHFSFLYRKTSCGGLGRKCTQCPLPTCLILSLCFSKFNSGSHSKEKPENQKSEIRTQKPEPENSFIFRNLPGIDNSENS